MTTLGRWTTVLGGYAFAFVVAVAAVYLKALTVDPQAAQAASGMYAFGETILFCGVFGLLAVIPTALALYWLLSHRA